MSETRLSKREIDRMYVALAPRLRRNTGAGSGSVTIPPHRHSADQIDLIPCGDVASTTVQDAICELAEEKLARDGHQDMLGNLNMGDSVEHDIYNLYDIQPMHDIQSMNDITEMNDIVSIRAEQFQTAPVGHIFLEGSVLWNEERHTLSVETEVDGFAVPTGQTVCVRGRASVDLAAGEVVRISSADDGIAVFGQVGGSYPTAYQAYAMLPRAIVSGEIGYAVISGLCEGIDTSLWSAGSPLYLTTDNFSVYGNLVTDAETADACGPYVNIGIVLRSDATAGVVFVHHYARQRMEDVADVTLSTEHPTEGTNPVDPVSGPDGDQFKVLTWVAEDECPGQWQDQYVVHRNIVERSADEAHPATAITFDPATTSVFDYVPTPDNVDDTLRALDEVKPNLACVWMLM